MVLTKKYLLLYVIVFLFFLNEQDLYCMIYILGQDWSYEVSGLAHYDPSLTADKLELLEEKGEVQPIIREVQPIIRKQYFEKGKPQLPLAVMGYRIAQEYLVRNTGGQINAVLGIVAMNGDAVPIDTNPVPDDLQFWVNEKPVKYELKEERIDVIIDNEALKWKQPCALINVDFPAYAVVKIRFIYTNIIFPFEQTGWTSNNTRKNCYPTVMLYNKFLDYPQKAFKCLQWKGNPRFSLSIKNDALDALSGVECPWIREIFLSDEYIALNTQSLENDLYRIKKLSENSWKIEFTDAYLKQYDRVIEIAIALDFMGFGEISYASLEDGVLWINGKRNEGYPLSEEKLSPYELIFLTNRQLRMVRNAIYARRGYIFKDKNLRLFFHQDPVTFQYKENSNFTESMLTEIDRANIETIKKLETMEFE